jgi:hypothetical protein
MKSKNKNPSTDEQIKTRDIPMPSPSKLRGVLTGKPEDVILTAAWVK